MFELNIYWALIFLAAGLYLLFKSADWLVTGSVSISKHLKISTLIIGLTIVAMGTSAPEVAASIASALKNNGDVALGNVYGSNIANLALIGGFCSLIRPITTQIRVIKFEIPLMIGVSLLLYPLLKDQQLSLYDGIFLVSLFAFYIFCIVKTAKKGFVVEEESVKQAQVIHEISITRSVVLTMAGIIGMALGARLTVDGGVYAGKYIGMGDAVIGMTIIAIGTSLPELITCVVAAMKKQDDISIGNLVGSNIFNTLLVTGVSGVVKPYGISATLTGGYYFFMIAVNLLFLILIFPKRKISRISGCFLLLVYIIYLLYLAKSA